MPRTRPARSASALYFASSAASSAFSIVSSTLGKRGCPGAAGRSLPSRKTSSGSFRVIISSVAR